MDGLLVSLDVMLLELLLPVLFSGVVQDSIQLSHRFALAWLDDFSSYYLFSTSHPTWRLA